MLLDAKVDVDACSKVYFLSPYCSQNYVVYRLRSAHGDCCRINAIVVYLFVTTGVLYKIVTRSCLLSLAIFTKLLKENENYM